MAEIPQKSAAGDAEPARLEELSDEELAATLRNGTTWQQYQKGVKEVIERLEDH